MTRNVHERILSGYDKECAWEDAEKRRQGNVHDRMLRRRRHGNVHDRIGKGVTGKRA